MEEEEKNRDTSGYNINRMCSDVLTSATNKGRTTEAFIGLIFLVVVLRLPPNDLAFIVKRILDILENTGIFAYTLLILSHIFYIILIRFASKMQNEEIKRLSNERNRLQEMLDKDITQSSEA